MTEDATTAVAHLQSDRYRLGRLVAEGDAGRVHLAEDTLMNRPVAVKLLSGLRDEVAVGRAVRAARTASRVRHPGLVRVLDVEQDSPPFLALEPVEGRTLADVLDEGPVDPDRAGMWAADVLGGLAALHEVGAVHRDVRAQNVLVDGERARLTTAGLAAAGRDPALGLRVDEEPDPAAEPADARADVAAAGTLLQRLLPGADEPNLRMVLARATDADPAQRHVDGAALRADVLEALGLPTTDPREPIPTSGPGTATGTRRDRDAGATPTEAPATQPPPRPAKAKAGAGGAGASAAPRPPQKPAATARSAGQATRKPQELPAARPAQPAGAQPPPKPAAAGPAKAARTPGEPARPPAAGPAGPKAAPRPPDTGKTAGPPVRPPIQHPGVGARRPAPAGPSQGKPTGPPPTSQPDDRGGGRSSGARGQAEGGQPAASAEAAAPVGQDKAAGATSGRPADAGRRGEADAQEAGVAQGKGRGASKATPRLAGPVARQGQPVAPRPAARPAGKARVGPVQPHADEPKATGAQARETSRKPGVVATVPVEGEWARPKGPIAPAPPPPTVSTADRVSKIVLIASAIAAAALLIGTPFFTREEAPPPAPAATAPAEEAEPTPAAVPPALEEPPPLDSAALTALRGQAADADAAPETIALLDRTAALTGPSGVDRDMEVVALYGAALAQRDAGPDPDIAGRLVELLRPQLSLSGLLASVDVDPDAVGPAGRLFAGRLRVLLGYEDEQRREEASSLWLTAQAAGASGDLTPTFSQTAMDVLETVAGGRPV